MPDFVCLKKKTKKKQEENTENVLHIFKPLYKCQLVLKMSPHLMRLYLLRHEDVRSFEIGTAKSGTVVTILSQFSCEVKFVSNMTGGDLWLS